MADLRDKIERLNKVEQERDHARAQLASVQKELENARQQQAQFSDFQVQSQELSQVGAQLRQEVVKLKEDLAAQSRELADAGGRLRPAQQETGAPERSNTGVRPSSGALCFGPGGVREPATAEGEALSLQDAEPV